MYCICVHVFLLILISFVAAISSSCYFYNQTLPIPMYTHLGIFSASKNAVYLFGGATGTTSDNQVYLNKVYKWDLNDPDSWFAEIGTTTPATGFFSYINNAVLVNEQVFFIGILHETWPSGGVMFVYDLSTESFLTDAKAAMPEPLLFGCLATNTTHIFMVDGSDFTYPQRLPIIQIYDVSADAWQSQVLQAGPMTTGGWCFQYCSLVGDALYVLGGNINWQQGTLVDGIYRIDLLTLEIEQLAATLPAPQGLGVSIYNANDDNLYLFGVVLKQSFQSDILAFDLDTHSVSTAFSSQQMYSAAPVLDVNGTIYRFGGVVNVQYNATDQVEICELPTMTPSNLPTLHSPTEYPTSSTPTVNPTKRTNSSTHPQYALNATIQFADVLPPNVTLQVVAVVRVYALELSDNITANCSEIANVSSRTENARTVVILSITILTCSRSAENELFAAFNASELGTRIDSVTQSDVDITINIYIVIGDDTGDEDPVPTEAQEEAEKPRSISWSLIAFGVVGFLLLVAVLWFVYRRFSAQSATHKQDEDVPLPQQPEQQHIVAQPDEHKDDDEPRFAQLLRQWGLAQFVRRFEAQGYTNVRVWTLGLTDDELKNMGLQSGHMRTFRLRCEELNAQMQRGLDNEQPGAASYSQAEGKAVGALTGVDGGNLVNVELVNMNMNEEQVTAEGDDDDDDGIYIPRPHTDRWGTQKTQQQPQTIFMG